MSDINSDCLDSSNEASPLLSSSAPPRAASRGLRRVSGSYSNISPIVEESADSITIRRPLTYRSINAASLTDSERSPSGRTEATLSRYKYYNKLSAQGEDTQSLLMPNHVVPPEYFMILPIKALKGKQHSLITIFSIWNTMMGTSLLSMPWAVGMAGFGFGLVLILVIAGLALYTAYRVIQSTSTLAVLDGETLPDFSDVCRHYLGRWGAYTSMVFSFIALLGAAIVYWVLMTNFLYNTVDYIYAEVNHEMNSSEAIVIGNMSYSDAYCPHPAPVPTPTPPVLTTMNSLWLEAANVTTPAPPNNTARDSIFKTVWHQQHTVPLFLVLIILPLANFKSPTFFTKFNALGTVSVLYILTFVSVKAARWGFHVEIHDTASIWYIPEFKWTFPALTGTLSLAYFIHNCVISIVQNQRNPENNARDLSIAYFCVAFTYLFVGAVFFCSFPLAKSCIEDNLLNNFRGSDMMAFVARICLFIQMLTVFPLLLYIIRAQFMHAIFANVYPSVKHVLSLNVFIIVLCVLFAVFLPQIGTIIRFSGALCGLVYIFALPCLVYIMMRKQEGTLTKPVIIFHSVLILLGLLNFIAQFLII